MRNRSRRRHLTDPTDLSPCPHLIHIPNEWVDARNARRFSRDVDSVAFARFLGLDALLRAQNGAIRRDQALATGMARTRLDDLVRRRRWIGVLPRVYAVGVPPADPRVRVRACWLWAGDGSAIAAAAAAWWLRLSPNPPSSVTVIIPPRTRRIEQRGIRVLRATLDAREMEFVEGIWVTAATRTCLDLAHNGEPDLLETALRLRRTDSMRLQRSLERASGSRGQVRARQAVVEVATNPWSASEGRAHLHLKDAGIVGWTANPPIRLRCGIRHPDLAIEEIKLAIEIDGWAHHGERQSFENDRARHNDFVREGWTVLQFTWRQVNEQPDHFVATIKDTAQQLRGKPS